MKELRGAGKDDEAAEVKKGIQKLERELERVGPGSDPDRRKQTPRRERLERQPMERRPNGEGRGPRPPEMAEAQRRLHHLQAAIDNLHAAGLHEAAERLTQEAERMRQQLHAATPAPPAERGPGGSRSPERELAPLRREIQELRQAVQELRRRLGELSREQP